MCCCSCQRSKIAHCCAIFWLETILRATNPAWSNELYSWNALPFGSWRDSFSQYLGLAGSCVVVSAWSSFCAYCTRLLRYTDDGGTDVRSLYSLDYAVVYTPSVEARQMHGLKRAFACRPLDCCTYFALGINHPTPRDNLEKQKETLYRGRRCTVIFSPISSRNGESIHHVVGK